MSSSSIPRFSPTSYLRFLACNKSVSLRNDFPEVRVKTPQKALLGQIAHKVLEVASQPHQQINSENLVERFEELWKETEEPFFARYEEEWFPSPVAQIKSWKSYFKTKIAARGLIKARLESKDETKEYPEVRSDGTKVLTEEYIENVDLGIHGYLDRLIVFADGIHVYDYKFGQSDLDSPEYKIQLGIYSILASRKYGLPVRKAVVVAGAGREYNFDFEPGFLDNLLLGIAEAQQVISNKRAKANPSQTNCRFCSFKPVCIEFNQAAITSDNGIPLAISGEVLETHEGNQEYSTLTIRNESQVGPDIYQVSKVPSGYNFSAGDVVHVSGPMQFFSNSVVEAKANTIFWQLS